MRKNSVHILYEPCKRINLERTLEDLLKHDIRFKEDERVRNLEDYDLNQIPYLLDELGITEIDHHNPLFKRHIFIVQEGDSLITIKLDSFDYNRIKIEKLDMVALCTLECGHILKILQKTRNRDVPIVNACSGPLKFEHIRRLWQN